MPESSFSSFSSLKTASRLAQFPRDISAKNRGGKNDNAQIISVGDQDQNQRIKKVAQRMDVLANGTCMSLSAKYYYM